MRQALFDAALVGGGAAVVHACLAQRTIYGDGSFLLEEIAHGDTLHPHHFGYKFVVHALWRLVAGAGVSAYDAAVACSVLFTALGVAGGLLGLRALGLPRATACAAAAAAALAPGVVFFATVVEFHGVFFGMAGLAFAAAGWLARAPSWPRALVYGAATWAAYALHASGHLLPMAFGIVVLADLRRRGRAPCWLLLALAAAVHVAGALLLARWFGRGPNGGSPHALSLFSAYYGEYRYGLVSAARTLWGDFLLAFLPLSVLWLAAFRRRETRLLGLGTAGVVAAYATAAFVLTNGNDERGAYLLPVVWLLALLVARALGTRALLAAGLVGGGVAAAMVWAHDDRAATSAFARGLRAQAHPADVVLVCGDGVDLAGALIEVADAQRVPVHTLVRLPAAAHVQVLDELTASFVRALQSGKRVFLTDEATSLLGAPELGRAHPLAPLILARIEDAFDLLPATREGFRARELRLRRGSGR